MEEGGLRVGSSHAAHGLGARMAAPGQPVVMVLAAVGPWAGRRDAAAEGRAAMSPSASIVPAAACKLAGGPHGCWCGPCTPAQSCTAAASAEGVLGLMADNK